MASTFGENIKLSIFGQSHSAGIGVVVDGLPAGFCIDMEKLQAFMARRAPGQNRFSTPRKEADLPEFLSGVVGTTTCGAPLAILIRNTNVRKQDYANLQDVPRPAHADYTARVKYGGYEDTTGGGHFSGRLTAPLTAAGGICKQYLESIGIEIHAEIAEIGGNSEDPYGEIDRARENEDSVGGIISCSITGMPAGIGAPMFGGMENRISQAIFAVPAVKGIEFGLGFAAARMRGSENNDAFYYDEEGQVQTRTNHHGGILGGISSGMPITFRVAVKPTPSIGLAQESISFGEKKNTELKIQGRHDPCIVPRAVPVIEAAAAVAVLDALLDPAGTWDAVRAQRQR